MTNLTLDNALDHNKKPIRAEDKIVPLSVSEDKLWYEKTPTDTHELVNKKYVDDRSVYDVKFSSYYTTIAANFIPLNGTTIERASLTGNNEALSWVAPYNGTFEKILWRSEIAQDGDFIVKLVTSPDGIELPASEVMIVTTAIDIADDTTVEVDFTSTTFTSGDNSIIKGNIYSVNITSPTGSQDTNATLVFKWDITA